MAKRILPLPRRQFLKRAIQAGTVFMMPQVIPGAVLGKDGAVAPSRTDCAGRDRYREPRLV